MFIRQVRRTHVEEIDLIGGNEDCGGCFVAYQTRLGIRVGYTSAQVVVDERGRSVHGGNSE
jgi:hypothetical protein